MAKLLPTEQIERRVEAGTVCCATCRNCITAVVRGKVMAECTKGRWHRRYQVLESTTQNGRDCPEWRE